MQDLCPQGRWQTQCRGPWHTLEALAEEEPVYSRADLGMLAEIIQQGEAACAQQLQRGTGGGQVPSPLSIQGSVSFFGVRESDAMMQLVNLQVTLMELLSAYEAVLGRHGVLVAEDSYYYRLLLKLSLDPGLDWWTKFQNVCRKNRRCVAEEPELLLPVTLRSMLPAADTGSVL